MSDLGKLYFDGGPVMHLLLMVFLIALSAMTIQAALARRAVVPGLFAGCSTAVLGTSLVGVGVGYRLTFDIVAMQGMEVVPLLYGIRIANIPLLFALCMVVSLLVLQFVTAASSPREVLRACAPSRVTRMLPAFGVLVLVLGALLLLIGHFKISGFAAGGYLGENPGDTARSLSRLLMTGLVTSGVAVLLAALSVVASVLSLARQLVSVR